jgi:hypothetical protein
LGCPEATQDADLDINKMHHRSLEFFLLVSDSLLHLSAVGLSDLIEQQQQSRRTYGYLAQAIASMDSQALTRKS